MTDAIVELRAERDALKARLEKVESAIAEYDRWAASVATLIKQSEPLRSTGSVLADPSGEQPRKSSISDFEASVRSVLQTAESPLQRTPLLRALEADGIVIGGTDPANAMSARLSRMPDVINLRGFGYWIKSKPFEEAAYVPAGNVEASSREGSIRNPSLLDDEL